MMVTIKIKGFGYSFYAKVYSHSSNEEAKRYGKKVVCLHKFLLGPESA